MSEKRDRLRVTLCPVCRKPASEKFQPFCCRRCADIDLNRWLSGVYAIAVTEDTDEDGTKETQEER